MRVFLALVFVAIVSVSMTGCQTSQGFGKDVQKLGEEIEDI